MKLILFSVTIILIFSIYKNSTAQSKENHYTVIKKIDNIEIRDYKKLIYVSYTPKNTSDRNNSFRNVAGYIFGGNKTKTKIDMTSPVVVKFHNKNEMAFIMPEEFTISNLPKPENKNLSIYEESSNIKACIQYSGYSNEKQEKKYIKILQEELKKNNIEHKNDFELLVYNSPYQFVNRRNEIVVSIKYNNMENSKDHTNSKYIYLGGGCFWCTEAIFEDVVGVKNVTSGFAGGKIKNPSYKEVVKGLTQHAEVCKIKYNPQKISLENILEIFFLSHDPTTINRQGNDIGKHYRSIILYNSKEEKERINNYINKINTKLFNNEIVTEVKDFTGFYKAEEYHQNYYKENKTVPYCKMIISPKLNKAKKKLTKYYIQ